MGDRLEKPRSTAGLEMIKRNFRHRTISSSQTTTCPDGSGPTRPDHRLPLWDLIKPRPHPAPCGSPELGRDPLSWGAVLPSGYPWAQGKCHTNISC